HGLVALMELQSSRSPARTTADGPPGLFRDRDRGGWDRRLFGRGREALARALRPGDTDWERIAALYEVLAYVAPSPVVELNRAVAVGHAHGPSRALAI